MRRSPLPPSKEKERKMQKDPEVIRMPRKRYRELEDAARAIREQVDIGKGKIRDIFTEADNYPTVTVLKEHHAELNLREYLPYLIFYITPGAFECEDDAYGETAGYIRELLSEYLDIPDDMEFERFDSIQPGEWKKMPIQERVDRFQDWIYYYNPTEFETFFKDIGWLKLMGAYPGYTEPAYRQGKECPQLERDLKEVWDLVQGEDWG